MPGVSEAIVVGAQDEDGLVRLLGDAAELDIQPVQSKKVGASRLWREQGRKIAVRIALAYNPGNNLVALALLQGRLSRSSLGVSRVPALLPSP